VSFSAACRKGSSRENDRFVPDELAAFPRKGIAPTKNSGSAEGLFPFSKKGKFLAQSWRVLSGISALEDRSTFMSARKRQAGRMSQLGKEKNNERKIKLMKNRNIIVGAVLSALVCFGLCQQVRATPDPGSVGGTFNTADGQSALLSVTTGQGNTAVGWASLGFLTVSRFNTATGAAALLSNTVGDNNTAVGTAALVNNTEGFQNTAIGGPTILSRTLGQNTEGDNNTAVGAGALPLSTGNSNIGVGVSAGLGVTTANNAICIGAIGQNVNDSCYIGNIHGQSVDNDSNLLVMVDSSGKLGTSAVSANGSTMQPQAMLNEFLKEHKKQEATIAQLKSTVEKQAATNAQQQKQIEALTAGLQKVSAQIQITKTAPTVVRNNP
jgi:hypothetical protein